MSRQEGSLDSFQRTRVARRGAWKAEFESEPDGKGVITVRNVPHRILAALEREGDPEGKSVQDIVRRHLEKIYPEEKTR